MKRWIHSLPFLLILGAVAIPSRADDPLAPWIQTIQAVGPEGQGNTEASQAWRQLSRADSAQLPAILASFDSANDLAANWLRPAVEVIADRALVSHGELPVAEIGAHVLDTRHHPRGRGLAFALIRRVQPAAAAEMIPGFQRRAGRQIRTDPLDPYTSRNEYGMININDVCGNLKEATGTAISGN